MNRHQQNKKLSIYTSIVTFILGILWVASLIYIQKIPNKEEAIAIVIILAGLNSVSLGSDLRGFLKIILEFKQAKKNTNNKEADA